MSLVVPPNFQHILRVLNTNIEGKTSVMFALTSIKGIGRRYANIVLKKADIPLSKRAGELTEEDTEKLITIMQICPKVPPPLFCLTNMLDSYQSMARIRMILSTLCQSF